MSEQTKKAVLLVVVIAAIIVAIWSGMNSFGNRERVVGDIGDLSAGKGKAGELQGGSTASGAPPGIGGAGRPVGADK